MPVTETGVSYYGLGYVDHAVLDFREMRDHNCNAVVLAVTEFDVDFWYPNISRIVDAAHEQGLRVYLDTWGIGKFFGGEQVSLFLQNNIHNRQVMALSGEPIPAACFASPAFQEYFYGICERLARDTDADGFFWDEPHWALPSGPQGLLSSPDWTCRCPVCQKQFEEHYGYAMPKVFSQDVRSYRREAAFRILETASRLIKDIKPQMKIVTCVFPSRGSSDASAEYGYADWDRIARCDVFDVFSTSIMGYEQPLAAFERVARDTVEVARRYGKVSQRWVMSYCQSPEDLDFIRQIVRLYADAGVDSVFSWTYRAGKGTVLSAPDPDAVWQVLGEAFGEVLSS